MASSCVCVSSAGVGGQRAIFSPSGCEWEESGSCGCFSGGVSLSPTRLTSELQLLWHLGGDVSEGQRRPPQAPELHAALTWPVGQLADLGLKGHAGAGRAVGAGEEERAGQVDLAAAALRRLPQGQNHLGRVLGAPDPHIPSTSGGPGLGRFLMPR